MTAGPQDWLAKAEADFGSMNWEMQAPPPGTNFDAVVFHAQQCVEKMLKGILAGDAVRFGKTHELNVLAHQVKRARPR